LQAAATELQERATLDTAGRCIDKRLIGALGAQQEKKRNQKENKRPKRKQKTHRGSAKRQAVESPQQSRKRE
jgi:hypothetical protein